MILPWLGVLIYLIARGGKMHERAAQEAARARPRSAAMCRRRRPPGLPSPADEVAKLAELHKAGTLTDAEFAAQKAKVLAG